MLRCVMYWCSVWPRMHFSRLIKSPTMYPHSASLKNYRPLIILHSKETFRYCTLKGCIMNFDFFEMQLSVVNAAILQMTKLIWVCASIYFSHLTYISIFSLFQAAGFFFLMLDCTQALLINV